MTRRGGLAAALRRMRRVDVRGDDGDAVELDGAEGSAGGARVLRRRQEGRGARQAMTSPSRRGGARPGAGRKPLPAAALRVSRLELALTAGERAELEAWAARREEPLVHAVRETVLREARRGGA